MKKIIYVSFSLLFLFLLSSCSNEDAENYLVGNEVSNNIDTTALNLRSQSSYYRDIGTDVLYRYYRWRSADDAKHWFTLKAPDFTNSDAFEREVCRMLPLNIYTYWKEIMRDYVVEVKRYTENSTGAYRLMKSNEYVNLSQYTFNESLGYMFTTHVPGTEPIYEYYSDQSKDYMYVIGKDQKDWMDYREPDYRYTYKIIGYGSCYVSRTSSIYSSVSVFFEKSSFYPDSSLDLRINLNTRNVSKTVPMRQGIIDGLTFHEYDMGYTLPASIDVYIDGLKIKNLPLSEEGITTYKYIKNSRICYITAYPLRTCIYPTGAAMIADFDYMWFFKYANTLPSNAGTIYSLN